MSKTEPERSCIVTREAKSKGELIRFVVGPDDKLVPDITGRLPGRGVYVTASRSLIAEAIVKRVFSKSLKEQVKIPDGLLEVIEAQLKQRMGEALSLARKSGQVVMGFDQVETAAKTGKVEAILHAADAGEDGRKKLAFYRGPVFTNLPRDLLSNVLGKENAVHAAIIHGPATQFFLEEARRYSQFLD